MTQERKRKWLRAKIAHAAGGGGWEVTYTGFILIMLCFFILLCSFATVEESKVTRFVKSFSTALSILSGGLQFSEGSEVLNPSPEMVDKRHPMADLLQRLEEIIRQVGLSEQDVTFSMNDEGLAMRLTSKVVFDTGEAEILPQVMPLLEKIGFLIRKTAYNIRIEGHTDDVPINTPKFSSNWELSTTRAVNVLRYFIEKLTLPSERFSAVGFGEYQPLSPNDTPEHRALNRRVEIVFVSTAGAFSRVGGR